MRQTNGLRAHPINETDRAEGTGKDPKIGGKPLQNKPLLHIALGGLSRRISTDLHRVALAFTELVAQTGQILDKPFGDSGWLFAMCLLLTGIVLQTKPDSSLSIQQQTRNRLEAEATKAIDELSAYFHARLERSAAKKIGATYVRFSTDMQNSFTDQLRSVFDFAIANGIFIPRENIFYDLAMSGAKKDRPGIQQLLAAASEKRFQCFLTFSSSRVARNLAKMLQLLGDFVDRGIRCVLVDPKIDSDDEQKWKLFLPMLGMMDDIQRTAQVGNIRAAHKTLLAAGMVYGTPTYGFTGTPIPDQLTKRHRPKCVLAVNEAERQVVSMIFDWFCRQHLLIGQIVKKLNGDPTLPRPHKSNRKRFSSGFVNRVLTNPRYLGVFDYRRKSELSSLSPAEMRKLAESESDIVIIPRLQIVSDEMFLTARARLSQNCQTYRRKSEFNRGRPVRNLLLRGFLKCGHCGAQLFVGGKNANYFFCKPCKTLPVHQQGLFSRVPRDLCTRLVVEEISRRIAGDPDLVTNAVQSCLRAISDMQKPDPDQIASLKRSVGRIRSREKLVIESFDGDAPETDLATKEMLKGLRGQRFEQESEIARLEQLQRQSSRLPDESEVRLKITRIAETVMTAAENETGDSFGLARELIRKLTQGQISIFQCGEKRREQGWPKAEFKLQLENAVMMSFDLCTDGKKAKAATPISVDIVLPKSTNPLIAQARALYDQNKTDAEISTILGRSRSHASGLVRRSLAQENKKRPNGQKLAAAARRARGELLFQRKSDQVFELERQGLPLQEIAKRVGINRDTVTESVLYAFEQRGLVPVDGRARRKLFRATTPTAGPPHSHS